MVLRTKRASVLVVALVVVVVVALSIGLWGAVGSASPKKDNPDNDKGHSTLTVVTKSPRQIRVIDIGAQGPSQGDLRVVKAPLYNETGRNKVGRFDQYGILTDPADESAEKVHMVQRTSTYTLPGGEISTQGPASYTRFDHPSPKGVDAVIGGTGNYAGVRGEVRYETRGTKAISTFHFID